MASVRSNTSHEERTATEPRDVGLHHVQVHRIEQINSMVRVIDLKIMDAETGVKFLPGQWLDVFIEGMPKAGGFTLTSTPFQASPKHTKEPTLQLAVQKAPRNPPAAWLWQPEDQILNQDVLVRVGGSFVWPPFALKPHEISKAIFIAAGVGINPLISMIRTLDEMKSMPPQVEVLYTTKVDEEDATDPSKILFLPTLTSIAKKWPSNFKFHLFITGEFKDSASIQQLPDHHMRRFNRYDLDSALGAPDRRHGVVCYVCGPPAMTDAFVDYLSKQQGMAPERVLCERWW